MIAIAIILAIAIAVAIAIAPAIAIDIAIAVTTVTASPISPSVSSPCGTVSTPFYKGRQWVTFPQTTQMPWRFTSLATWNNGSYLLCLSPPYWMTEDTHSKVGPTLYLQSS